MPVGDELNRRVVDGAVGYRAEPLVHEVVLGIAEVAREQGVGGVHGGGEAGHPRHQGGQDQRQGQPGQRVEKKVVTF